MTTEIGHQADVATVFVATCDLAAKVRGRAVPVRRADDVMRSGIGWVPANIGLTGFGDIADGVPFGSVGDLRLVPDKSACADLPGDPAMRVFLGDLVELDGSPWSCCPRTFLRDALDRLRQRHGLEVTAAFEHEFRLDTSLPGGAFALERHRAAEPFGTDLVRTLDAMGLAPETWLPEYAADQFEITVAPANALTAADRAIFLREAVREVARRNNHVASFAPIDTPEGIGNGVHVHLSLATTDGESVTASSDDPSVLSDVARRFVSGILSHARALCAIAAPSPVSYLRLAPHKWSVGGIYAATADREALVRICTPVTVGGGDPRGQLNVEFRGADATANPWLLLGALVVAGTAGLETSGPNEFASAEDAEQLPRTLPEALDALDADETLRDSFPADLLTAFRAIREKELELLAGLPDVERCRRVASVY